MATTASNSQAFTIRQVETGDAPSVAELSGQLGYPATRKDIAERIAWVLGHADAQTIFVACLNGEVVGWIEAAVEHHLQSPPFSLITGLVVRDGVRGLGAGKRLCEEVERWSREKGLPFVRVTSRSTREATHRFYLRDGYRQIKTSAVFEKALS